jgi:uncharacterized membrane protein YuzA (DUF378 family)
MVKKKITKKCAINSFLMLGIVLFNLINSPIVLNARESYNLALEKGTQIMEINHYDRQAWNAIVNVISNPNDWFGGEADRVGAKCKTTVLFWMHNDVNTYGMFHGLMIPKDYLPTFTAISDYGYNYTYIKNKFSNRYLAWNKMFDFRSFTLNGFSNFSDSELQNSIILHYPENISKLLDDYNEFASIVNNDTALQSVNYSLPILSGDDFLWHFVLERYTIETPIIDYLTTLIGILECINVSVQGKTLTIKRNGIKNYTVEATYNDQGNLETFLLKNSEGYIIYKITSYYPKITVLIIVGICGLSIVLITTIFLFTKKKKRNQHSNRDKV